MLLMVVRFIRSKIRFICLPNGIFRKSHRGSMMYIFYSRRPQCSTNTRKRGIYKYSGVE